MDTQECAACGTKITGKNTYLYRSGKTQGPLMSYCMNCHHNYLGQSKLDQE